ncbi:MAG: O-antigen ligase family protein [Candidatus Promineifilaceae bacterium]
MSAIRRTPLLSGAWLVLALLCVLRLGALRQQRGFMTRGIPSELPGIVNHGGARLGMNVYLERYRPEELPGVLDEIKATGATAVKQSFYFEQPFNWKQSDDWLAAVEAAGLEVVPLLDGDPVTGFSPPDVGEYAAWAGEFAGRYAEQVDYYIIWDEPNLGAHWGGRSPNPAEYAALLSAAADAIWAADAAAFIVAAPLAPTVEQGPDNLAETTFLAALYESGAAPAFDVVAAKPYGFDSGPHDRRADISVLNFSRAILLREIMEQNGDHSQAVWAANWGWNSLPAGWEGDPSIWGQVDRASQAQWTAGGLERARYEWPWMGLMFLENWEPNRPADDPWWGFSIAGRPAVARLADVASGPAVAYPGFHPATQNAPAQTYTGDWRFARDFGADVGRAQDSLRLRFWGTDVGILVRRGPFNARFYVTIDGRPANVLPQDDIGAALVLNSPEKAREFAETVLVASGLAPAEHVLELVALHSTDQWSLKGFAVGYRPERLSYDYTRLALAAAAAVFVVLAVLFGLRADWGRAGAWVRRRFERLRRTEQMALAAAAAAIVALAGWLTWGEQAAGLYRRLGDGGQLALTAAAASLFYVAPSFLVYAAALVGLFVLLVMRPAWGLALIAFSLPFYVKPKPMLGYRFSPVEVFTLVTLAGALAAGALQAARGWTRQPALLKRRPAWRAVDLAAFALTAVATLSLVFTKQLDVATNEWRVLVLEGFLFYLLLRWLWLEEREAWTLLDAYVAGGLLVALIGLVQYVIGANLITAEGGLLRLRSVYGSPNNVALYLGRMTPLIAAVALFGRGRRRSVYALLLIPIGLALGLTYSRGALLLGLPVSLLVVFSLGRRAAGGRVWPWLVGAAAAGLLALLIGLQIPAIAARLDPQGSTGIYRLHLWRSSLNMIADHPIIGVGLDNFLYEYRGRYILDAAWQEPDLNHPHNLILDFLTRLGLLGFLAGAWLFGAFGLLLARLPGSAGPRWQPLAVGLVGSFVYLLAHGLVDHSFFLVDLGFSFYLLLGVAVWLAERDATSKQAAG